MTQAYRPLADRLRPTRLDQMAGQQHLLAPGKPIHQLLQQDIPQSMILWGPPGTGKTTLAMIIANHSSAELISMSAVLGGIKEVRAAVVEAEAHRQLGKRTVLFVDEVHRFNKSQQDAFLPHIESGLFLFIGATTENPSFQINQALLSRLKVHVLKSLSDEDILIALSRAAQQVNQDSESSISIDPDALMQLARAADGDARRALNLFETVLASGVTSLDSETVAQVLTDQIRRFDHHGDQFYDQISALHKCVRGSDPDAALYWFCRMIDGGCDPEYLCRRMVRMASEDIGNADPRALPTAISAWDAWKRLGSPEGELAIAHAIIYLAVAPKSNAVYSAYRSAMAKVRSEGSAQVPNHLRNAPTPLMKAQGAGAAYQYDHDLPDGVAYSQQGFPDQVDPVRFYLPASRGLELRIGERLNYIRARRYPEDSE